MDLDPIERTVGVKHRQDVAIAVAPDIEPGIAIGTDPPARDGLIVIVLRGDA
jgi:hypothetical protein